LVSGGAYITFSPGLIKKMGSLVVNGKVKSPAANFTKEREFIEVVRENSRNSWLKTTTSFRHPVENGRARKCYTWLMSVLSSDTHPKMEALQIQLWRQASPTRKMHMLAQLNASAHTLALMGLRSRYPQASQTELHRRLAGLVLGEELARKVYGEMSNAK
jgi:hypothetical protein